MRLINVRTKALQWFNEDERPPYAILSHTWGSDEITLQEFALMTECEDKSTFHPSTSKAGYRKIEGCCDQARRDGLEWVWVDTCCIDKTSSAELSEAINSMYRWYKESRVCYVYLEDVSSDHVDLSADDSPFRNSRWFTRGWTLQELVAPLNVSFFSNSWTILGVKSKLESLLEEITGISFVLLSECGIHYFSIAQRMCWAAKRKTSRKEDIAYCLLGIFDVSMPLLYGEGDKAFQRLQEEIIKQSIDQTIFTWRLPGSPETDEANDEGETISILATSPSEFIECADMVPYEAKMNEGFEVTQKGIRIELQLTFTGLVILKCRSLRYIDGYVAIKLRMNHAVASPDSIWAKWPQLSWVDFTGLRLRNHNPTIIRPDTPYKMVTFYLQVVTQPSTSSLLEDYHRSSIVVFPAKNEVYESLHVDQHLKIIHHQGRLIVRLTKDHIPSNTYKAFFSCRATISQLYLKIEFCPKPDWGGDTRYEHQGLVSGPVSSPTFRPTLKRLERLEWKDSLIINNSVVHFRTRSGITSHIYRNIAMLEIEKEEQIGIAYFRPNIFSQANLFKFITFVAQRPKVFMGLMAWGGCWMVSISTSGDARLMLTAISTIITSTCTASLLVPWRRWSIIEAFWATVIGWAVLWVVVYANYRESMES